MKLISALILTSTLFLLLSCVKPSYVVKTQTEYPYISEQAKHPRPVPEIPTEPLTIGSALSNGREMRGDFCVLYSQYIELMRSATFGEVMLDRADNDRCPENYSP